MALQELPKNLKSQDLFLDVKLTATSIKTGAKTPVIPTDLTGKDSFSVGMMRDGKGFGITDIKIETNTSLQPIVDITFKDFYGNTVFGVETNSSIRGTATDYSLLFDFPPPKFELYFKGYLGKPVTWIMNLKKINTTFNSTDGAFIITASFIPNHWGFFADIPFLYLYAVKRLKTDSAGINSDTQEQSKKGPDDDKVKNIFDLINIGKRVDFKSSVVTKEFDSLNSKLVTLKLTAIDGLINGKFKNGDIITGKVGGRADLGGDFKDITINLHSGFPKDESKLLENLKQLKNDSVKLNIEQRKIIALIGGYSNDKNISTIGKLDDSDKSNFDLSITQGQAIIDNNIKEIEKEIKRRTFETNNSGLGLITISDTFSRLAGDAAFILGGILAAGERGYKNNASIRDPTKKLIGQYYPLILKEDTKEQVPAEDFGINDDGCEMNYVDKFITAISEGIAEYRKEEAEADLSVTNNKILQRINNLEILSNNPYAGNVDYKIISDNILIRSGIAAFVTRSFDPNVPGNYAKSILKLYADNDSTDDIGKLVDGEFKNLEKSLSTLDSTGILSLKRFCDFFIKLLSDDGKFIKYITQTGLTEDNGIIDLTKESTNLLQIINKNVLLDTDNKLLNKKGTNIGSFFSQEFSNLFYAPNSNTKNTTPTLERNINLETFTANFINHNNILYSNVGYSPNNSIYVIFTGGDVPALNTISNNGSDSENNNEERQDVSEPLGIIKIDNADPNSYKNKDTNRLTTLNKMIQSSLVVDYSKIKNFINTSATTSDNFFEQIVWPRTKTITPEVFSTLNNQVAYTVYGKTVNESDFKLVWGLFNKDNRGINQRFFIKKLCGQIQSKLVSLEEEKNNIIGQVLGNASSHRDSLYQQFHNIFYQWRSIILKEDNKNQKDDNENFDNIPKKLEEEYSKTSEIGDTNSKFGFVYDYPMQRVQPSSASTKINVANSVINIDPLYKPNANTTILNIIQSICTKNNFLFIPIPGNSNYLNIGDIFKPSIGDNIPGIGNFFHVLFTPTPESRNTTNDGNSLSLIQKLDKNISFDAFEINFGSPDNSVIKNINVSTENNKPTAESILNLQKLVDKDNSNKTISINCSMLSVMEGRSYNADCEILGNAQISPMQFFVINNTPIFGGLYQIMKVSHSFTPNDMKTTFTGMKLRYDGASYGGVTPITIESLKALGNSAAIEQPMTTSSFPSFASALGFFSGGIDSRNTNDLVPLFKSFADIFIAEVNKEFISSNKGFSIKIISTYRNFLKQQEIFAQGRTTPGQIVSNSAPGSSFHNWRRAFDIGVFDKDGRYIGNPPDDIFDSISSIGFNIGNKLGMNGNNGLIWGGNFVSLKDRPHWEWHGGENSLAEPKISLIALRSKFPNGLDDSTYLASDDSKNNLSPTDKT